MNRLFALLLFVGALMLPVRALAAGDPVAWTNPGGAPCNTIAPGEWCTVTLVLDQESAVLDASQCGSPLISQNAAGTLDATIHECETPFACVAPSSAVGSAISDVPQSYPVSHLRLDNTTGFGTAKAVCKEASASGGGGGGAETDPVYTADPAASITDAGSGDVITAPERAQLTEIRLIGAVRDTSFTSGQCASPTAYIGNVIQTCGTRSEGTLAVPTSETLTVSEVYIAAVENVASTPGESCIGSLATGDLGDSTVDTETDFIFLDASAASVTAGTGLSTVGGSQEITLGAAHVVAGDDWLGVRWRTPVNGDCTAAGEPLQCCVGLNDATGCVCDEVTGVSWVMRSTLE